jgi:hypothetical protein
MGHKSLETTMGYLHSEALSVPSPLEALCTSLTLSHGRSALFGLVDARRQAGESFDLACLLSSVKGFGDQALKTGPRRTRRAADLSQCLKTKKVAPVAS